MDFFHHNIEISSETKDNIIKVIGVGGGGSNAVSHMFEMGIDDVDFAPLSRLQVFDCILGALGCEWNIFAGQVFVHSVPPCVRF